MRVIVSNRSEAVRVTELEIEMDQADAILGEEGGKKLMIYRVPAQRKAKVLMKVVESEEV